MKRKQSRTRLIALRCAARCFEERLSSSLPSWPRPRGCNITALGKQAAVEQLRAAKEALHARRQLRESNLQPARLTEAQLKALDASVKKNTALIRRLRAVGDGGAGLLEDIRRTNQSKASYRPCQFCSA